MKPISNKYVFFHSQKFLEKNGCHFYSSLVWQKAENSELTPAIKLLARERNNNQSWVNSI